VLELTEKKRKILLGEAELLKHIQVDGGQKIKSMLLYTTESG
jgi:hypothetical protein